MGSGSERVIFLLKDKTLPDFLRRSCFAPSTRITNGSTTSKQSFKAKAQQPSGVSSKFPFSNALVQTFKCQNLISKFQVSKAMISKETCLDAPAHKLEERVYRPLISLKHQWQHQKGLRDNAWTVETSTLISALLAQSFPAWTSFSICSVVFLPNGAASLLNCMHHWVFGRRILHCVGRHEHIW